MNKTDSHRGFLTDAQWDTIKSLVLTEPEDKPGEQNLREIVNAILYVNRTNCEWSYLPEYFPHWIIVYDYFQKWEISGTLGAIYSILGNPKEETLEIITKKYSVKYDRETDTLYWHGVIRLESIQGYEPLRQLLNQVVALEPLRMTLNIRKLKVLNSSGLSTLGRFIFNIDQKKTTQSIVVQSTNKIAWQKKWAKNFQRLVPTLQIEWE